MHGEMVPGIPAPKLPWSPCHPGRGWPQVMHVGVQDTSLSQSTRASQCFGSSRKQANRQASGLKFKASPCHTHWMSCFPFWASVSTLKIEVVTSAPL